MTLDSALVCGVTADALLEMHLRMLRIRLFEEEASRLYRDGNIPGFLHVSIGQEATAVGACWGLRSTDAIVSTHRGHGHSLAKGTDMTAMFAELFGRAEGTCGGFGGSMHIADLGVGVYGANGIVGAGLPIGAGIAEGFRQRGTDDVVVVFFGDGAVAQGAFHEAMNLSSLWKLPVLFLCENNGYAEFSATRSQHPVPITERARSYGIESTVVDGDDVIAVASAVEAAIEDRAAPRLPFLLEAVTHRLHGHYEGDAQRYRHPDEVDEWRSDGPLLRTSAMLDEAGLAGVRREAEEAVRKEVLAARDKALLGAAPKPSALLSCVKRPHPAPSESPVPDEGEPFRVMDGLREALRRELSDDPTVWLAGIDVGSGGNIFGITRGLYEDFPDRVLDTPISETVLMGLAVGGAMAGTRPVVELMYFDFIGVCFDQVMNQAAKIHFMTGGQASVPLVIRTQCGAGRSSGGQHSQSLEALLAHIPGLTVVMPSTPADAYGLLRSAIQDSNPVVFIENRLQYGTKGPRPHPDHLVPIGRASRRREGSDVTIVSWSRMVDEALRAAKVLESEGIQAEVLDLRTIAPLDEEAISKSVSKTGRLVIAHEAVESGGFGAEIAARIASRSFWSLDGPILRVAPPAAPAPYSPELEAVWLPGAEAIATAARTLCRT